MPTTLEWGSRKVCQKGLEIVCMLQLYSMMDQPSTTVEL
jgi:hypothetical protein